MSGAPGCILSPLRGWDRVALEGKEAREMILPPIFAGPRMCLRFFWSRTPRPIFKRRQLMSTATALDMDKLNAFIGRFLSFSYPQLLVSESTLPPIRLFPRP